MARARSYCFTSFKLSLPIEQDGKLPEGCTYICWGEEVCPTSGRKHLQGFVQFAEAVSIKTVKRRVGDDGLHLERRRGSVKDAVQYCAKDGCFKEYGDKPKQGERTDITKCLELVLGGLGLRGIIDTGVNYQALRYTEKVLTYKECGRTEPPTIRWYWGETGTGKTRAAITEASESYPGDVWWANGGVKWFDGYDGHEAAIFDDFRPEWCKLAMLLRLLDRYPLQVPIKGGFRQWKPAVIYITCPKPPEECYLECGEDTKQLLRRVTYIKEFE